MSEKSDKPELEFVGSDDLLEELLGRYDAAVFVADHTSENNERLMPLTYQGNELMVHAMLLRASRRMERVIDECE